MKFTNIRDLKYVTADNSFIDLFATCKEYGEIPMTLNLVDTEDLHTFVDKDGKEYPLEEYCKTLEIAPYVEPVVDIKILKASKLLTINTECNKAIVSGFKSSALGEEYFYYSTLEEQTTLNSLVNLGFDSNFKAQKISLVEGVEIKGERKQYPHTLAQLREILIAGATHIKAQIDKKDLLEIQINNTTTAAELELINW